MRRLALLACALLLTLTPTPVRAAGQADQPPVVITPASGQLVVFEKSTASTRHVFKKSYNGSWTGWTALIDQYGDTPFILPANLTPISPSQVAAFTQLADGSLWCGSTGLPWNQVNGRTYSTDSRAATPAVLNLNVGNYYDVVGISSGNHVIRTTWQAAFSPAGCNPEISSLDTGGLSGYTPAIAGTAPTDFLLAVAGTDGKVYWSYNSGAWQATAFGQGQSATALTTWGGGRYDLFVRGTDGAMWHTFDPSSAWESLGGVLASGPGCAAWAAQRIDCMVIGTDGNVYHKWWDGAAWNGWENLGTA